jgi:2-oxoglutarate dehydrogenase E1 component
MSAIMGQPKDTLKIVPEAFCLDAGSAAYLEQLYDAFLSDPTSVIPEWRQYFEQLKPLDGVTVEVRHLEIQAEFRRLARLPHGLHIDEPIEEQALEQKQSNIHRLIKAYRLLGHLQANIDPLNVRQKLPVPELTPSYYQLNENDLNHSTEMISAFKKMYCDTIAYEFMHIPDAVQRLWIQNNIESAQPQTSLTKETKIRLLQSLLEAEGLEKYIGSKYPGAKRFSLEGTDSLIVALDTLIQQGGVKGAKEVVICMAHRGRLNVLVNLLGKIPYQLFDEFEGKPHDFSLESGDVKYHQGFSANVSTPGGPVHLSLAFNPSHLEIVTPVICGSVKARQERRKDNTQTQVLSIAVHGDAAFSGQGVVMETLNMARTRGFNIGGTVHIVVNNQIGFTTSNPEDARSTLYCSDIGKMVEIPIFHVNANDPEAVFKVMKFSLDYREKFKKDVIVDLIGYRRQGHNEADEPAATQPLMYQLIRSLPTAAKIYTDQLITEKSLTEAEINTLTKEYRDALEIKKPVARDILDGMNEGLAIEWAPYVAKDWRLLTETGVSSAVLEELGKKQLVLPVGMVLHPRVEKIRQDRQKIAEGLLPMDWGYAETLAYATLLSEGFSVRLSGQDVGRGTFFHRHAVLYDQQNGSEYIPLSHLSVEQGHFSIVNSLLSEEAVLGFEYGYSTADPKGLTIWEAQFGDFANNAQVVIDQFISSGEQKWGRQSGVTLFLPHGYEGQGAEHSSARLERYLQLCAEHNIQVCIPTTPAQIFHLIRRQVKRPLRKPLIVLTPKSLLRHKWAVSSVSDLETGEYAVVLPEKDALSAQDIKKIVFCSGKIYYELLENRRTNHQTDIAIIRIEQLYPFPDIELTSVLQQYRAVKTIVWCQEEPENQGAWPYIQPHLKACLAEQLGVQYAGRPASAAPAVGYLHLHQAQQSVLIAEALR